MIASILLLIGAIAGISGVIEDWVPGGDDDPPRTGRFRPSPGLPMTGAGDPS